MTDPSPDTAALRELADCDSRAGAPLGNALRAAADALDAARAEGARLTAAESIEADLRRQVAVLTMSRDKAEAERDESREAYNRDREGAFQNWKKYRAEAERWAETARQFCESRDYWRERAVRLEGWYLSARGMAEQAQAEIYRLRRTIEAVEALLADPDAIFNIVGNGADCDALIAMFRDAMAGEAATDDA